MVLAEVVSRDLDQIIRDVLGEDRVLGAGLARCGLPTQEHEHRLLLRGVTCEQVIPGLLLEDPAQPGTAADRFGHAAAGRARFSSRHTSFCAMISASVL